MTQPQQATSTATRAAQAAAVVVAYQAATAALRVNLTRVITALWGSLGQYREPQMRQFVAQTVPIVHGAMQQMQSLTAAYLATLDGSTPVSVKPLGIGDVRSGADPAEVYGRPFHLVWRQLHEQQPLDSAKVDAAIQSGLNRATQTAATDLQLAKTHTAQATFLGRKHIVGWRRVLEGAHSCALCCIAATVRYHTDELMPIHPGCDCAVAPIVGDEDPGRTINGELLDDAHTAVAEHFGAESTAARDIRGAFKSNGKPVLYRDVLITHQHGELGPVIAVRGQKFTGPAEVAADIEAAAS